MSMVDTKAERIVDLLDEFRAGKDTTVRQVAERYGISQRTAQRLLLTIDQSFLPLTTTGKPPVYRMWRYEG